MTGEPVQVTENEARRRYEAQTPAGVAVLTYERRDGRIDLQHTLVPPAAEGRGLGGALVRRALDDARSRGDCVIPTCPFVAAFIADEPGYADLVCG